MTVYEKELQDASDEGLDVKERPLKSDAAALIKGNRVALNKRILTTTKEKSCTLAEERGHYHTTVGDILDLTKEENRRQEYRARLWAYNNKIGLAGLISAYRSGCRSLEEFADALNVTEDFLTNALDCYQKKYGANIWYGDYCIQFIPYFEIGTAIIFTNSSSK